jgi:hypothetical protein
MEIASQYRITGYLGKPYRIAGSVLGCSILRKQEDQVNHTDIPEAGFHADSFPEQDDLRIEAPHSKRRGFFDLQGRKYVYSLTYPGTKPGASLAASRRECARCQIQMSDKRLQISRTPVPYPPIPILTIPGARWTSFPIPEFRSSNPLFEAGLPEVKNHCS